MKKRVLGWGAISLLAAVSSVWGQASWTCEKPYVWARDENAVALEKQVVVERWRLRFPPARVASAQGQDAADTQAGAFAGEA